MIKNIRQDKFAVGDQVTWFDDYWATLTDGRKKFGDGPFQVLLAKDEPFVDWSSAGDDRSNWSTMGHTQYILIELPVLRIYSGAFFKKVS